MNFFKEIRAKAKLLFIEVQASEELIRERLKRKRQDSEADYQIYQKLKKQFEPVEEEHLILQSTDDNITSMLDKAMNYYKENG